jgi:hypothetical protein
MHRNVAVLPDVVKARFRIPNQASGASGSGLAEWERAARGLAEVGAWHLGLAPAKLLS